jgi:hypothetical protein
MLNANLCPLIFFKSRNTNNFVWESFSVGRTEWQIAYFPGRRHRTSARDAAPAHHRRRSLHRTCGPGAGVTAPSPSTGEQPAYLSLLSLSLSFSNYSPVPSLQVFVALPAPRSLSSPPPDATPRLVSVSPTGGWRRRDCGSEGRGARGDEDAVQGVLGRGLLPPALLLLLRRCTNGCFSLSLPPSRLPFSA